MGYAPPRVGFLNNFVSEFFGFLSLSNKLQGAVVDIETAGVLKAGCVALTRAGIFGSFTALPLTCAGIFGSFTAFPLTRARVLGVVSLFSLGEKHK